MDLVQYSIKRIIYINLVIMAQNDPELGTVTYKFQKFIGRGLWSTKFWWNKFTTTKQGQGPPVRIRFRKRSSESLICFSVLRMFLLWWISRLWASSPMTAHCLPLRLWSEGVQSRDSMQFLYAFWFLLLLSSFKKLFIIFPFQWTYNIIPFNCTAQ